MTRRLLFSGGKMDICFYTRGHLFPPLHGCCGYVARCRCDSVNDSKFMPHVPAIDWLMRNVFKRPLVPTICLVVVTLCSLAAWAMAEPSDLGAMKRFVRIRFPQMTQLSTADLAQWLADTRRPAPLLLDVRTEEEFRVSHLHGAVHVDPGARAEAVLSRIPKGRRVVTYCSVGYRSSALAERLRKAGVGSVYNLEGSIFQWANEGRALESAGRPADKVHPYSRRFGALLEEKRRAELKITGRAAADPKVTFR